MPNEILMSNAKAQMTNEVLIPNGKDKKLYIELRIIILLWLRM
jgi:hypothetical protein